MSDFTSILGGTPEELVDLENKLKEISSNQPWSSFKEVSCVDIELDFEIDPDHFLLWLEKEKQDVLVDDYKYSVTSMCEYACLYIAMMLHNKQLQSIPRVHYGKFGFWEHYWVGYVFNGQEYFIDLTLRQFVDRASKLSISKAVNSKDTYNYTDDGEYETIQEYIERQRALKFYRDPQRIHEKTYVFEDIMLFSPTNLKDSLNKGATTCIL